MKSIQKLKDMAEAARGSTDQKRERELAATIQSLEAESAELLLALKDHHESRHTKH